MKIRSIARLSIIMSRIISIILGVLIFILLIGFFSEEISDILYNRGSGIQVPGSSQEYVGSPYLDVFEELVDAGFTNVIVMESKDKAQTSRWIGKIQSISISGERDFFSGKKYKEDVTIIIVYYSE